MRDYDLGTGKIPSPTRAMVISHTNAVNHPIELIEPSLDIVR